MLSQVDNRVNVSSPPAGLIVFYLTKLILIGGDAGEIEPECG